MTRTKDLLFAARLGHDTYFRDFPENEDIDFHKDEHENTLLSIAAENGRKETVKLLVEKKANINAKNNSRQTPLSHAAENGYIDIVETLLEHTDDIDPDSYERAVSGAATNGYAHIVTLLLVNGRINSREEEKYASRAIISAADAGQISVFRWLHEKYHLYANLSVTFSIALYRATLNDHISLVEALLETNGIDINYKGLGGRTALHVAAKEANTDIAELLLAVNTVRINAQDEDGCTALHLAAGSGSVYTVKSLLERDQIDINAQDKHGGTAFSIALRLGNSDVVELLLARDEFDLDAAGVHNYELLRRAAENCLYDLMDVLLARECVACPGRTPLSWSAENGQTEVLEVVLWRDGTDPNSKDHNGRTPLSLGSENGHSGVVEMLLQHNADANSKDHNGRTPLSLGSENGHSGVVEMLLQHNADANSKDGSGRTSLSLSAENGHESVVKMLLHYNADPNSKDIDGRTPLWWAVKNGHEGSAEQLTPVDTGTLLLLTQERNQAAVKFLLRFRPQIDQKNHHGRTSLHLAALSGHLDIASVIILQGAETSPKDNYSMTPLQLAIQRKNADFIQLLLKHKASMKGIMAKEWRDVYGKQKADTMLLSEGPYGKHLDFPETFPTSEELVQTSAELKSRLYVLTDDLNSAIWSKVPITVAQQQPAVNHLQITERMNNDILDISISLRLSVSRHANGQPSKIDDIKASRIMWRITQPMNPDSPWVSIVYFSTLPYGWIPDDGVDLFEQFLTHIKAQWLESCDKFGEYLSNKRLEQLESKGKSPKITDCLANDAQRLAELRTILASQTSEAEKFMNDYCARYNANQVPQTLRMLLKEDIEIGFKKRIEDLDQIVRDLLQIEFAWITIHETRMSTKLGQNVMLLTYVSIFYLPLGFCAALWAIPNITDDSTRTPFILTATMVSLVTLLVTFNMESIATIIQRGYQGCGNYIAKEWDSIASKWKEKKEAQYPGLP